MGRLPAVAWSTTVSWKVIWPVFTNVALRDEPPTFTTEVGTKFEPLSVIVAGPVAPATTLAGLAVSVLGTGLLTVSAVEADVPPPGEGLKAVIASVPPTARSDAVSVAEIWFVLWKAVVRALPFTWTVVAGTKLVPVRVAVADAVSAMTLAGLTCATAGVGLFTTRFTAGPDELLPPLMAVTERVAPPASWPAGTTAVTWVLLMKVVASAVPPT
jgi:hypothetical protein